MRYPEMTTETSTPAQPPPTPGHAGAEGDHGQDGERTKALDVGRLGRASGLPVVGSRPVRAQLHRWTPWRPDAPEERRGPRRSGRPTGSRRGAPSRCRPDRLQPSPGSGRGTPLAAVREQRSTPVRSGRVSEQGGEPPWTATVRGRPCHRAGGDQPGRGGLRPLGLLGASPTGTGRPEPTTPPTAPSAVVPVRPLGEPEGLLRLPPVQRALHDRDLVGPGGEPESSYLAGDVVLVGVERSEPGHPVRSP